MSQRQAVELVNDAGDVVAKANATLWTRATRSGLMDWGGGLDLKGALPPIDPGAYRIRFEDGREAAIFVNNVRIHANGSGVTSSATFIGNGELPLVAPAR